MDGSAIEPFMVRWVARELKLPESSIDGVRSFFDYGLDSVTTVMLGAALEDWLRIDIPPELVYEVPEIRRFAAELARRAPAS